MTSRLLRPATALAPLLAASMLVPSAASAAPPDDWGWAVVRDAMTHDYTITGKDRGSRSGGDVSVLRTGTGKWTVTFADLPAEGGNVHVTPLTGNPDICSVVGWNETAGDLEVEVACYSKGGDPKNVPFVASFLEIYSTAGLRAYLWANQPSTANYTPDVDYNDNSTGPDNTVHRTGTGQYVITMPGINNVGGNVQVSTYGSKPVVCRTLGWEVAGSDLTTTVNCRKKNGNLVDSKFTASYLVQEGLKGNGGPKFAYMLADQKSDSDYVPNAAFRFADPAGTPHIKRTAKGQYNVRLTSMPLGGAVQVTPFGTGGNRCNVTGIRKSDSPQRIGVACFKDNGSDPADSKFTLSYEK